MSEIVKYDGRDIATIDIEGRHYVAMKPIVEGMGLNWDNQLEMIKKDAVLSEGIAVTAIPSKGGTQQMVCLPLDYLNGWLFKVPASRYKGERREKLIQYQRECYKVLSDYFSKGGAVNPAATAEQLAALVETVKAQAEDLALTKRELKCLRKALDASTPVSGYAEISRATGEPRIFFRRSHWRSSKRRTHERNGAGIQLLLALARPEQAQIDG